MNDPFNAIMKATGFEILQPSEEYLARKHTEIVFSALRKIGVGEDRLPDFADKVARAGYAGGPRDIAKENRVAAEDIERAIADIEAGLRLLNKGLHTIGLARSTATPNSTDRIENLAVIHAALVGAIADGVASGIGAGSSLDEMIADSVPEYGPGVIGHQWTSVFSIAADRVKHIGEAFPRTAYHAQKKDRSAWLGRLIPELGKIFEEVTGKLPVISNPSEKAGMDWRCPFARFVEGLWGYLDPTDGPCPGDDQIMGALTHPAEPLKTT
jgi:hypothetical protein